MALCCSHFISDMQDLLRYELDEQTDIDYWPVGMRMRVKRWVESQRALYAEHRLSRAQLRYLALLGELRRQPVNKLAEHETIPECGGLTKELT